MISSAKKEIGVAIRVDVGRRRRLVLLLGSDAEERMGIRGNWDAGLAAALSSGHSSWLMLFPRPVLSPSVRVTHVAFLKWRQFLLQFLKCRHWQGRAVQIQLAQTLHAWQKIQMTNFRSRKQQIVHLLARHASPLSVTGVSHRLRTCNLCRCSLISCRPASPNCQSIWVFFIDSINFYFKLRFDLNKEKWAPE